MPDLRPAGPPAPGRCGAGGAARCPGSTEALPYAERVTEPTHRPSVTPAWAEPLPDSEVERVLVVTAHPDDADYGAAGTIAG